MPSTFRIPKADLGGLRGRLMTGFSRRSLGQVADPLYVYGHHPRVMSAVFRFEGRVRRWHALDPHLQTYAQLAAAAAVGCSWCVDFGYYLAHTDGLDEARVREVPRWRTVAVFTPGERRVLAYAEAMSATPPTVTDEMVADLVADLGAAAVVELTQLVALENMRSRFNSAAGLASQGFSDVCELPLADPSAVASDS